MSTSIYSFLLITGHVVRDSWIGVWRNWIWAELAWNWNGMGSGLALVLKIYLATAMCSWMLSVVSIQAHARSPYVVRYQAHSVGHCDGPLCTFHVRM
jgi:hypothetical protein